MRPIQGHVRIIYRDHVGAYRGSPFSGNIHRDSVRDEKLTPLPRIMEHQIEDHMELGIWA